MSRERLASTQSQAWICSQPLELGITRGGNEDNPAMRVMIPAARPSDVGVMRKMICCSTGPVVGLLMASAFHRIDMATVTAPLAMKNRFVRA